MTQRRIYQCAFPYFVTFNVLHREWLFEDEKKAELLHEIILNAGVLKNHLVYQFAIMPDHVHILCQPQHQTPHNVAGLNRGLKNPQFKEGGSTPKGSVDFPVRDVGRGVGRVAGACDCRKPHRYHISDFIKSIRGTFSRYINVGQIWHPRFYDQIIEDEKRLHSTIDYIISNPIKAELPGKYQKYPYQFKDDGLLDLIAG